MMRLQLGTGLAVQSYSSGLHVITPEPRTQFESPGCSPRRGFLYSIADHHHRVRGKPCPSLVWPSRTVTNKNSRSLSALLVAPLKLR